VVRLRWTIYVEIIFWAMKEGGPRPHTYMGTHPKLVPLEVYAQVATPGEVDAHLAGEGTRLLRSPSSRPDDRTMRRRRRACSGCGEPGRMPTFQAYAKLRGGRSSIDRTVAIGCHRQTHVHRTIRFSSSSLA
jgi:hypothetical protein